MRVITVIRKPLSEGNVARNCVKHGTGALNIDACRIEANGEKTGGNGRIGLRQDRGWNANNMPYQRDQQQSTTQGRWPANLIHDGSDDVVGLFPQTGKSSGGVNKAGKFAGQYGAFAGNNPGGSAGGFGDDGSARFFFSTKGDT